MNLSQVIADLEKKSEDYKAAAESLRSLLVHENQEATKSVVPISNQSSSEGVKTGGRKGKAGAKKTAAGAKSQQAAKSEQGGKRIVSPETRAKIAAAMKAKHEARKNAE